MAFEMRTETGRIADGTGREQLVAAEPYQFALNLFDHHQVGIKYQRYLQVDTKK